MQAAQTIRWGWKAAALLLISSVLSGCGINKIPTLDEQVKAAWAQVQNQYQRRADLIPNLVEVVKGYAAHEQDTLTAVIEARAKATSIQVDASTLDNPEKLKQFQQAQEGLSGALSRLMVFRKASTSSPWRSAQVAQTRSAAAMEFRSVPSISNRKAR